jgi:hypothetical protein
MYIIDSYLFVTPVLSDQWRVMIGNVELMGPTLAQLVVTIQTYHSMVAV